MGEARVALGLSNLSHSRKDIATGGIDRLRDWLDKIDPDGIKLPLGYQITPTQAIALSVRHRLLKGIFNHDGTRQLYDSGHQAWGGLTGIRAGLRARDTGHMFRSLGVLGQHSSLAWLKRLGGPAVVYSGHRYRGFLVDFGAYGFPSTSTQIAPEMAAARDVSDGKDPYILRERLLAQRIGGVTVGTQHIARASKHDPSYRLDHQALLHVIKETDVPVLGAHAEFACGDVSSELDYRRTREWRTAVLAGPEAIARTMMGDVLGSTYAIWRDQNPQTYARMPVHLEFSHDLFMGDRSLQDYPYMVQDTADHLTTFFDSVEQRLASVSGT